ncbi:glycerophosphoryl diester phosphodiesterase family protein [Streptococcus agalactiae CNCTC 10/84]|nr:glycerophosphoryl diester phosphodiesterase family protein [Streptococcus agalactiae CNCTC 10/84]
MLFRMVPKLSQLKTPLLISFRAVLFRMVPKQVLWGEN